MSIQVTCSCGQVINAADTDAGREVTCAACHSSILVPAAPAAPLLGYQGPAAGTATVTLRAIELLRQTALWVRIMSVLMFIGSGFMVLGAGIILLLGLAGSAPGREGPPPFLGCIYIPLAVLYIIPGIFLWRYATHAKAFALNRQEHSLEEALQAQKSFWKFVALMALILIGLYLLAIPIIIISAFAFRHA